MIKHRNDFYGDVGKGAPSEAENPVILAATVLLLRDRNARLEVLMLQKTTRISFGGMWVFPGGRIDPADYGAGDDDESAAINAAVRETQEEASITIPREDFSWFAHWKPPPRQGKRFSTWFFVTRTDEEHDVVVDGGEIQQHQWLTPAAALDQHAQGKIDLVPPTWVSLYQLAQFSDSRHAIEVLSSRPPRFYQTRIVNNEEGVRVALWDGDAGYATGDASNTQETHRLIMAEGGFRFQHSAREY